MQRKLEVGEGDFLGPSVTQGHPGNGTVYRVGGCERVVCETEV